MKKTFFFVFLVLCSLSLWAQVRNLVPIVKPVLHESTKEFLLDLSKSMAKDGYKDAAEYLEAWADGGFGSGFVYVDDETGINYVLTNSHVVAQAHTVNLEFEKDDGSTSLFKECPVLAVSETLDLALIGFPAGAKPFTHGLSLAKNIPQDGSDVWSAGFPGLLSRPSWQFGKGSVTNNRARVPELADPDEAELVQHSAPIDPGSSGGPLLAASDKALTGYEVVAINTWKVGGRQDTNFAIPANAIQKFIEAGLKPKSENPVDILRERAESFVAAANATEDSYRKIERYISYDLVAKEGERLMKDALISAPTKIRNDIIEQFVSVSPVDGLRLAVAYAISQKITPEVALATNVGEGLSASSKEGALGLSLGDNHFQSQWIEEHGHWRLSSFPPIESAAAAEEKATKDTKDNTLQFLAPYDYALSLGGLMFLNDDISYGLNVGYNFSILNSNFFYGALDISLTSQFYKGDSSFRRDDEKAIVVLPRLSLIGQVPFMFGSFYIVPFAKAGLGYKMPFTLNTSDSGFAVFLGGGFYMTFPSTYFSLGFDFTNINTFVSDLIKTSNNSNCISIFIKYGM